MLTWPKTREQIAAPGHGSKTFRASRGSTLADTLKAELCTPGTENIPREDLSWMEDEFADMLRDMNYPAHLETAACPSGRAVPSLELSRRSRHDRRPLVRLRNAFRRTWRQLRGAAFALPLALCSAGPVSSIVDSVLG
jgi:hypothetical protein